ncbi:MAG TPA: hypothetical protein VFN56_00770 [Candidatus Saccharimonadales bacterium]|nr:hypothetical protein [Candidatus Saccharimonadales bacterium]
MLFLTMRRRYTSSAYQAPAPRGSAAEQTSSRGTIVRPIVGALAVIAAGVTAATLTNRSTETMPTTPMAIAHAARQCTPFGQQLISVLSPDGHHGIPAEAMYTEVVLAMRNETNCSVASLMARIALMNPGTVSADGSFRAAQYNIPLSAQATPIRPSA